MYSGETPHLGGLAGEKINSEAQKLSLMDERFRQMHTAPPSRRYPVFDPTRLFEWRLYNGDADAVTTRRRRRRRYIGRRRHATKSRLLSNSTLKCDSTLSVAAYQPLLPSRRSCHAVAPSWPQGLKTIFPPGLPCLVPCGRLPLAGFTASTSPGFPGQCFRRSRHTHNAITTSPSESMRFPTSIFSQQKCSRSLDARPVLFT